MATDDNLVITMSLQGHSSGLPQVTAAPRLFEHAALTHPAAPALKDAAHPAWITYHALNQGANKLARCLLRRVRGVPCGNPDGDRVVAVCMAPSSRLVTSLLAIHKAGAAYLPLDMTFPSSRVAHIIRDSRPALLLAHGRPKVVEEVEDIPVLHLEDLEEEVTACCGNDLSQQEVGMALNGDSIAIILYTSGSTGVPKGVRVPHRAVLNRLAWQWHTFPYQENEVCCFKTTLTFVDSISEIFGPLLSGRRVVVVPKAMTQTVDELVNVLEEARVNRLILVPTLLRAILAHCSAPAAPKLPALRLWVCSGEVFPSDLLHSFFATFRNGQTICNFYGSTEVMGDVTFLQLHDASEASARLVKNKVPIGSPIDNNRIYFLNVDGEEVEEGSIGEVYVAGLNVAKGYVGGAQPDKFIINKYTEDPDYSILYRTGDFARVVDGLLVFEGRADTQIKVRGHRVDMNEVEMVIKKIKGVNKVTVMCYNPGEVNQNLLAFYTSEVEALSPEEIKKEFATLLQPYMQPQVIRLDDLPLLVNGKVDRQHLLKMYKQQSGGNSSGVEIEVTGVREGAEEAAATSLLRTVARVLGPAVAKGTTLSLDTSFFDVGGNSLNSVLTVTSLQDLGYSVGIGDFMRASLLREVLNHMKKMSEYEKHRAAASPPACSAMNGGYQLCTLSQKHREAVISLIGESFSVKGDLERWLKTEPWEYKQLLEDVFDVLVEAEISLVYARKGTGEVVACCLNFDLRDEPQLENISPKLAYVLAFLESVESPSREGLPEGPGEVMHCFMMGTLISLGPAENVQLIQMMEQENLRMATRRGFKAVFTTNTSDLTQQVCDDLLSYTVLHDAQVNTWVAEDGTRPFSAAPDTQHAVCTVKFL